MAETPAAANVSDSADRISHATYTSVSSAISRAKQAAADVGINTNDLHTHEFSEEYFQGRTSFAFELTGLDSATSIGEIEEALEQLNGVKARIVYTSNMAWISANRGVDISALVGIFKHYGIEANLTDSSLRRRMAWSDVEEGRYRRSRRQHRRKHLAQQHFLHKQALEEEKQLEYLRKS